MEEQNRRQSRASTLALSQQMQRDAKIDPEDQMKTQTGPIDEVQALKSIFYTFFNTSQKS